MVIQDGPALVSGQSRVKIAQNSSSRVIFRPFQDLCIALEGSETPHT